MKLSMRRDVGEVLVAVGRVVVVMVTNRDAQVRAGIVRHEIAPKRSRCAMKVLPFLSWISRQNGAAIFRCKVLP